MKIALLGDWGTGDFGKSPSPALQIARALKRNPPDIAIHLGDIYDAGTPGEERNNFLADWAPGTSGCDRHLHLDGPSGLVIQLYNSETP